MQSEQDDLAKGQLRDAERVDLEAFLEHGGPDSASEFVHVLWDRQRGRIALFRSVGEAGDGNWLRTDIEGVIRFSGRGGPEPHPDGVYITGSDPKTLFTLLDRMRVERSPVSFSVDYWAENNSQMMDESRFNHESVFFRYRTDSGRENEVHVHDVYRNIRGMMGKF